MHQVRRVDHVAAEDRTDALRAEAYAEQRMLRRRRFTQYRVHTARIFGASGARPHDGRVILREQAVDQTRVIVADHVHLRTGAPEEVREVVGERIVVVHEQQLHAGRPKTARTMPVLCRISSYSAAGSLSATMPAEACQ